MYSHSNEEKPIIVGYCTCDPREKHTIIANNDAMYMKELIVTHVLKSTAHAVLNSSSPPPPSPASKARTEKCSQR